MSKRVLLTGHGGFVGHHCLEYFLEKTDWELICIDSFRHKGTCRRVSEVSNDPRVKTLIHDLSVPIDHQLENLLFDRKVISNVVEEKPIDIIINLASESAVERSLKDPVSCLTNNYNLAINMLEFARRCQGLELFVQISTDEVYGEASPNSSHKEWDVIMPSNPYSASKAAQEALAIAYWRTYNLPIVITNIMNIIGERQDPEKFLPKIIQNVSDALVFISKIKPAIYNSSLKSCGSRPDRYNICGEVELNNLQMAQLVAEIMGKKLNYRLIPSESARPGYDRRYMLDNSKLTNMGWTPFMDFRKSVELIVNWTLKNNHWLL